MEKRNKRVESKSNWYCMYNIGNQFGVFYKFILDYLTRSQRQKKDLWFCTIANHLGNGCHVSNLRESFKESLDFNNQFAWFHGYHDTGWLEQVFTQANHEGPVLITLEKLRQ